MMNNLKITYRSLKRNQFYTGINVIGLSIGMAAAILLLVWIHHQWSYDRFHAKEKQLYIVYNRAEIGGKILCWDYTPMIMGPTLKSDYPEIVETTRFSENKILFAIDEKKLNLNISYVDPGFLTMFSFPLLQGNEESALNDIYSVILTEKTAIRLFGKEDPIGKTILLETKHPVTVTGVMKDLPSNTAFDFEALLPYAYRKAVGWYDEHWENNSTQTYVEIQPQANDKYVNQLIGNITKAHTDNKSTTEVFIYPLSKFHLYNRFENGQPAGGRITATCLLGVIALLILLIACINFMNLSTARAEKRAKEVGVRKVMGGKRTQLIFQFLEESTLMALAAGIIAIFLVELALPSFSMLMGKTLSLDLTNGWFWLCGLIFILFTGLLAGSYPAFYLSSFRPVKVLKGVFKGEKTLIAPRKILVITQYTFAIFLIIATLVIHRQIQHAQNRDNGYNKDQLIYVMLNEYNGKNYKMIKHDLLNSGTALSVTKTSAPVTEGWSNTWGIEWTGKNPNEKIVIDLYYVDADWSKTVGTTIIQGRDIDINTYPTDSTAVLLNETAVKVMNFDQPVGENIRYGGNQLHVIGIVKDFILRSPYQPVTPMVIGGPTGGFFNTVHIRLDGNNKTADNLARIEQVFKKYDSEHPFEYHFIDERYARKFREELTMGKLATWFAGLTIFISCMGLFALVSYMTENRKKEIGIRKVLGASAANVMYLLSKEFLILGLISVAVASPVAWWAMNMWLANYIYHANIPWWLFAVVALSSLLIVILTVSFQAIKAAMANPVKAIKSE